MKVYFSVEPFSLLAENLQFQAIPKSYPILIQD